jgi:hypothetical protein
MSALGHSRRFDDVCGTSAHPPIADMRADINLRREGPIADMEADINLRRDGPEAGIARPSTTDKVGAQPGSMPMDLMIAIASGVRR